MGRKNVRFCNQMQLIFRLLLIDKIATNQRVEQFRAMKNNNLTLQ